MSAMAQRVPRIFPFVVSVVALAAITGSAAFVASTTQLIHERRPPQTATTRTSTTTPRRPTSTTYATTNERKAGLTCVADSPQARSATQVLLPDS